MNKKEHVLVVICNWNNVDDLILCVESVLKTTFSSYDLMVVDNGSDHEILDKIKQKLPQTVILLINTENKGGAGGFNRGLTYALENQKYTSVWLLDNDVIVAPNCLVELVKELRADKNHGIVGSLILKMAHPDILQELGAFVDWDKFERVAHLKNVPVSKVSTQAISVDYVAACSLLVDCDALRQVGLLNEEYFLYFDDTDWCCRFQTAGYLIRATTKAKVWHKSGGTNKKSMLPTYYSFRNGIYFFKKYGDREKFFKKYLIDEVFTALYITFVTQKTNAFKTILNALVDAFMAVKGKTSLNLPLDNNRFGCYLQDDFDQIAVLGNELEHHKFLIPLLEQQKNLHLPVIYYTNKSESDFSEGLRKWVELKPLEDFVHCKIKNVIVTCEHLLKAPSPLEEKLKKSNKNTFFLDQYCNFYRGLSALQEERERYLQLISKQLARPMPR